MVVDAESGKELASYAPDHALNPASCMKVLTSATALSLLGPNYHFTTGFYADTAPRGGTIGTLYVAGSGDPMFVTEEIERMADDLRARGLNRVTGGIVIDNSYFDSFDFPHKGRNEMAKTSAVAVNWNEIGVKVGPGARAGAPAEVSLDPPIAGYRIVNKVVTRPKFAVDIAISGDQITVTGRVPPKFEPQTLTKAMNDPTLFAGEMIRYLFGKQGIEIAGPVRAGRVPQGSIAIAIEPGRTLAELVSSMNKHSNNFMAEQMLKHLGAVRGSFPGSTEKGIAVIRSFLASVGVPNPAGMMENGSGLSEFTRVSARELTHVLTAMYRDRKLRDPFVTSLSVLGIDGTMKRWRRNAPELEGVLYAKTGTVNGVSTLAGYVPMSNGRVAAFAILANAIPRGAWGAHQAQLAIVRTIALEGRR
jgi:D-alanyl-D-alanine carboxypeptidase/D-alanyl-D-alanine-endopeptidase (penicillin-binding protein 4)